MQGIPGNVGPSWHGSAMHAGYVYLHMTGVEDCISLRGEPTELCNGNCHRNKTILFWSNGMTSLNQKYGVPIERSFFLLKWSFRLKSKVYD